MKLLKNFDAEEISVHLEEYLNKKADGWRGKEPVILQVGYFMSHLQYEISDKSINEEWNIRHQQQAVLKSLRILSSMSVVEFVSLTKTKLTLGFIHSKSGVPFKTNFKESFIQEFGDLMHPKRFLKYGEW